MFSSFRLPTALCIVCVLFSCSWTGSQSSVFAQPSVKQAMTFRPVQSGIQFDKPAESSWDELKLERSVRLTGLPGYVVIDAGNRLYRRFVDTNDDQKIDTWAYYRNGVEVYRDEDTTGNTVPDTFRWLGSGGTKCGIDEDGDRKIDRWERISAQEAAEESISALAKQDKKRLLSIIVTAEELGALKLDPEVAERIADRLKKTLKGLKDALEAPSVAKDAKWLHFSASAPGLVPAGKNWVSVYDNVSSIVEIEGKNFQVAVGSMIKTKGCWKVIELPVLVKENEAPTLGGVFFENAPVSNNRMVAGGASGGVSAEVIAEYQKAEDAIRTYKGKPKSKELASLHSTRSESLKNIIKSTKGKDQLNWAMQYADLVGAAYQSGDYPKGLEDLKELIEDFSDSKEELQLAGYLEYRALNAWFSREAEKTKNLDDLQDQWRERLEKYIEKFPKVPQTADALFQLANTEDYLGDVETATKLYRRILSDFPNSPLKKKARGAAIRLTCEGKTIELTGKTLTGSDFKLSSLKGKMVLIHYWATWSEPCKAEFETMLRLYEKYKKLGFEVVSISLDEEPKSVLDYLQKEEDLPWIHLYAPGGPEDSDLAAQLGIIALPSMLLLGKDGKVVDHSVTMLQVERELRKLRK